MKIQDTKKRMNILTEFWAREKEPISTFVKKNGYRALLQGCDVIEGESEEGHKTFNYFHKLNNELIATHVIWNYDDEYVYEGYETVEFTDYGEKLLREMLRPVLEEILKSWNN